MTASAIIAPCDLEDEILDRLARYLDVQLTERTRAYNDGYDQGFLDGLEVGLKQLLADAGLALGRAA